jgi:hypothetical protein
MAKFDSVNMIRVIRAIFAQQQGLKNDSNENLFQRGHFKVYCKGLISVSAFIPCAYVHVFMPLYF